MVSSEEVSPKELQKRQSPDGGTDTAQQTRGSGGDASQQEGIPPSNAPEKPLENTGGRILQLDKEGSVSSLTPRKLSHTPGSDLHSLQSGQERWSPSIMREKVSEDGYRWRKYGQKLVKGNEFIRSYYKCTHPSCQVKKQLECSHDGKLADIVYIGEHEHPKPQPNLPQAVGCDPSIVEEKPDNLLLSGVEESQAPNPIEPTTTSQISTVTSSEFVKRVLSEPNRIRDEIDDDQRLKQRKKGDCNDDSTPLDKPTGEPRLVIQTKCEVDTVSDGYRWRKYGQKLVKGNPNPRSYYRCSSPGCPVKKHVERAYNDPKLVITSYEGQHDHDMPTVAQNTTGLNNCTTTIQNGASGRSTEQHDGESRTESKEKSAACGDRTITPDPESSPYEQHMLNSKPGLS
uniref:WRKY transcription factor 1 n=1 Tax=Populus alba TaxID=43335 RepID=A0A4U5MPM9_POPAL|nr:WRKY transcription factor 1 [Populus alba]